MDKIKYFSSWIKNASQRKVKKDISEIFVKTFNFYENQRCYTNLILKKFEFIYTQLCIKRR